MRACARAWDAPTRRATDRDGTKTPAMLASPPSEFTERERWIFDNDGVIVVPNAISACVGATQLPRYPMPSVYGP